MNVTSQVQVNEIDINIDATQFFPDDLYSGGDSGLASFAEKRPLYMMAASRYLAQYREKIKNAHFDGGSGRSVVRMTTKMIDLLILSIYDSIISDSREGGELADNVTIVAIGGYGRGELNPYSDVDIMFLYNGKDQSRIEGMAQKLLYLLWDLKLDVGYSVRTVSDCVEMAKSDLTVKTALLDSRYIAGTSKLYDELERVIEKQILAKESDSFISQKVEELKKRREKFGSSIYILEPNIKESEGGLRDLHTAIWVAKIKYKVRSPRELIQKGILSEDDLSQYNASLEYLWRIRNEIHFVSGRKNDQLTFECQARIAEFFGYKNHAGLRAEEHFMQDYYLRADEVEHFSSLLIARCAQREERSSKILGYFIRRQISEGFYVLKGEIIISDEKIFEKDPSSLMRVFEHSQRQEAKLSLGVKTLIRDNLHLVNDKFRRSKKVNASFLNILNSEKGVVETLRQMHHLKFLNRFIPEFEKIHCRVQHDLYHIYTVDIHSLFCVEELLKLKSGERKKELPLLTRLAQDVDSFDILIIAVLLHDIGKGEGNRHAERGADMIPTITRRMGLGKEESETIEFLIRNHLSFAHIAQRRDLGDERMIIEFARQMGTSGRLADLYLLTYSDIRGVGPDVWTEWKANLLQELYEKSFSVIERGNFSLDGGTERVKGVKKEVFEILEYDFSPHLVKNELKTLTTRHLMGFTPVAIAGHLKLLLSLSTETPLKITLEHNQDQGATVVSACTYDIPGLFSKIAGVMAANGFNILTANILTCTNGKALDVLNVNSSQGMIVTDSARWSRFESDLAAVLTGMEKVSDLVLKRKRPAFGMKNPFKSHYPTRIDFDNEISSEYTVIDVYTDDSIGLLYRITAYLASAGLYIGVAKISTKADQVADVFYVKDIFGQKVTSEEKLAELNEGLKKAIEDYE